ncbi:MAG: cyclase family protein [Clostridia bacterium]|nr:cyclase family protein [Clostridia bacterium]
MKVIDLTHTIRSDMPVYPGTEQPVLAIANAYEKDGFKETRMTMCSHTGTHIDAPAHIFADKKPLDSFLADSFVGRAIVIDCRDIPDGGTVNMDRLKKYGEQLENVDFLLFNFGWDKKWGRNEYFGNYPCVGRDVLDYIIRNRYKGIGFDVISLDPISELAFHKELFSKKEIINIENLTNLDLCGSEPFLFCCLPMKIENSDGAPARAVAILDIIA